MRISDWSSDVCSSDLLRESSEGTEWSGLVDGRQRTAGRQGSHDREKATEGRIVGFRCPDDREGQDIVRISACLAHDVGIVDHGTCFAYVAYTESQRGLHEQLRSRNLAPHDVRHIVIVYCRDRVCQYDSILVIAVSIKLLNY